MNSHKCDLCGLYLSDDTVCEECIKAAEARRKISDNYNDLENKEDPENEYYLRNNR